MEPHKDNCGKDQCGKLTQQRMNYFMGRHLTARDFSDEQAYHRSHRLFHNRMLHGWGVACGLDVRQHTREDCRDKYVEVTPGMAIDCCGREVVVECNVSCGEQALPEIPWKDYRESHPLLLLCLSYAEKGIDPVPVLDGEGDCSETKNANSRYKEGWKLSWHWVSNSDLTKYYWKNQYGVCPLEHHQPDQGYADAAAAQPEAQDANERDEQAGHDCGHAHPGHPCPEDDCGDPCSEDYKSCIEPRCPPHHCIALAVICAKQGAPVTNEQIITKGRPMLPHVPHRLTRIARINWRHGSVISPNWFRCHEKFVVTFDRKLEEAPSRPYPGPWGVNAATFVVQYGEQYEDLDFAPYEEEEPPRLVNKFQAEYKVSPRGKKGHGDYKYLVGHIVWITLKCDYLYDCHGVRVDGNDDGIAGGTFESWVSVVSDYEYE